MTRRHVSQVTMLYTLYTHKDVKDESKFTCTQKSSREIALN